MNLGDTNHHSFLQKEVAQYYAVEYRTATSDPWLLVHPAFGNSSDLVGQLNIESYDD